MGGRAALEPKELELASCEVASPPPRCEPLPPPQPSTPKSRPATRSAGAVLDPAPAPGAILHGKRASGAASLPSGERLPSHGVY
jgi:hypothetical protein